MPPALPQLRNMTVWPRGREKESRIQQNPRTRARRSEWEGAVSQILGATKAEVVNAVIGLEAAAETVAHEGGEIARVLRPLRSASAEQIALQPGVAARVAGHHRRIEVSDPFPHQSVQIVDAPEVRAAGAGREYHSSTWRLNSASFSPSGRVRLADAAYSHWATVGKRLPFHCA